MVPERDEFDRPQTAEELLKRCSEGERDFQLADLRSMGLSGADLGGADLSKAILIEANLTMASLQRANLTKANLEKTNLFEANLSEANLFDANLHWANFSKADLQRANLTKANLDGANLDGADLRRANLTKANLTGVDLTGADLSWANLTGVDLTGADLSGAILGWTDLTGADLSGANLSGANLIGADLSQADLSSLRAPDVSTLLPRTPGRFSLLLNSTKTLRTRFPRRAADPWSILKANYTGPKLAFHLLVLLGFFLPFVLRASYWSGINRAEDKALDLLEGGMIGLSRAMITSADSTAVQWAWKAQHPKEVTGLKARKKRAADTLDLLSAVASVRSTTIPGHVSRELNDKLHEQVVLRNADLALVMQTLSAYRPTGEPGEHWVPRAKALAALGPSLKGPTKSYSLWQVLLGWDVGWWSVVMSVVFLLYNAGRGYLTYQVGPMREADESSGVSPAWDEYRRLYWVHFGFSIVLWFAVISFCVNIFRTLSLPVLLPA